MKKKFTSLYIIFSFTSALTSEFTFLDALKYASQHISPAEWNAQLITENIAPADNHLLDRLILRVPVEKNISLAALLSLCEEIKQNLPENENFEKACYLAIGDQLQEPHKAQWIIDNILASFPNSTSDVQIAVNSSSNIVEPNDIIPPSITTLDLPPSDISTKNNKIDPEMELAATSFANGFSSNLIPSDKCLNISYTLYMDWAYFASLQSVYPPLLCCKMNQPLCFVDGFFQAIPHYAFSKVDLGNADCKQNSPGISLIGGKALNQHWFFGGMLDYGRSFNSWNPQNNQTSDITNRWSLTPSILFRNKNTYVQGMFLGSYNYSKYNNKFATRHFNVNHWGFGARLDGGIYFDMKSENTNYRWGFLPRLCLDYFSAFQDKLSAPNVVYVKNAQFFRSKGLVEVFGEFFATSNLCVIPAGSIGFSFVKTCSTHSDLASCDAQADYPNWYALELAGSISFFFWKGFVAKIQADITLAKSVQIYQGNVALGRNW